LGSMPRFRLSRAARGRMISTYVSWKRNSLRLSGLLS